MQTLSTALIDLVISGAAGSETAALAAPNQHDFLLTLVRAEKERAAEARGAAAEQSSSGALGEPSRLRLAGRPGER